MSLRQYLYELKTKTEGVLLKEVKTSNEIFFAFADIDSYVILNGESAIKLNNGDFVFVKCDSTQLSALIKKISKKRNENVG